MMITDYHWTCHTKQAPWFPRQYHDVAVFDNRLWIQEGAATDGSRKACNTRDVWYSDDDTNWTELPGTPWKERHAAGVFVHQNALWMVAGNNMQRDVWKLEKSR